MGSTTAGSSAAQVAEFTGAAVPLTEAGLKAAADHIGVKPAELWTVLTVETAGFGYLADRRPTILFERHLFHRKTNGKFDGDPDISNATAGGYQGFAREYDRLAKAVKLDRAAALESASWGLGQVLGLHAATLGWGTAEKFVQDMLASEDNQLQAMAAFIKTNHLDGALREHRWADFARGYNGPGYAKNQYDKRLEMAYSRLSAGRMPDLAVRAGQAQLIFLGFKPGSPDGFFGHLTATAMNEFQTRRSLPLTHAFDQATYDALREGCAALPVWKAPAA